MCVCVLKRERERERENIPLFKMDKPAQLLQVGEDIKRLREEKASLEKELARIKADLFKAYEHIAKSQNPNFFQDGKPW